jgi:hypothetical protein
VAVAAGQPVGQPQVGQDDALAELRVAHRIKRDLDLEDSRLEI